MTATPYAVFGEPVHYLGVGADLFAVTYPQHLSDRTLDVIRRGWKEAVGDGKRLIVLDGGAQLTRLDSPLPAEPTPIYDALTAERGCGK